jgi:hypothetical protein
MAKCYASSSYLGAYLTEITMIDLHRADSTSTNTLHLLQL